MDAKVIYVGAVAVCVVVVAVLCLAALVEAAASGVRTLAGRARSVRGWAGLAPAAVAALEKSEGDPARTDRGDAGRVMDEAPAVRARRLGIDELQIENMTLWSERSR